MCLLLGSKGHNQFSKVYYRNTKRLETRGSSSKVQIVELSSVGVRSGQWGFQSLQVKGLVRNSG